MMRFWIVIFLFSILGCSSPGPKSNNGIDQSSRVVEFHYYEGEPKPLSEVATLSTEQTTGPAKLYFISVDGMKEPTKRGIIGGPLRAFVLPGTRDVTIQYHDQGRIIMPVTLAALNVKAGRSYHLDSQANYSGGGDGFAAMLNARINLTVTDTGTNEIVFNSTVNGMGKKVETDK